MKEALKVILVMFIFMALVMSSKSDAKVLRVAVIDSGFGFDVEHSKKTFKICDTGSFDFISGLATVGDDHIGHGSMVTALINKHADTKNMCFLVYKVFGGQGGSGDVTVVDRALIAAYRNKADIINMSLSINSHSTTTKKLLNTITRRGVKVFAASGNDNKNLNIKCNTYPSCYKALGPNFIRVGALDQDGDVAKYSNHGASVTVYKYGRTMFGARGTSFAAPRAAGDYIKSLKMDGK